ncbi:phosphotransferase [Streptomyces albus]|uniref:phosphotransferase n=1 Tax=Streptomyces albus TaxID=1888 RepID=UPI0005619E57|nr:phosphotransferase [Streptomyces albus]
MLPRPDEIAAAFGLGQPLGAPRPLANGDGPSATSVLATDRGRWVVKTGRLLGDWQCRHAHHAHRLEQAALAAGVPLPRPVEPPEPAVGAWHRFADGPEIVRVTPWAEGHDLRTADAADTSLPDAARWTGDVLGRIALLGLDAGTDLDDNSPVHPMTDWHAWVAEAETGGHAVARPARALLPVIDEATALILHALEERPRTVLVHGDTSRANILRTPAGYLLLDWDSVTAEVPWWETVSVAFRFATPFNGPMAEGDPRVVRPVIKGYLARGAPGGPAEVSAFAGLLRSQLASLAWCLWLSLGHRGAGPAQRAFGLRFVASAAEHLPRVLASLERWTALLR